MRQNNVVFDVENQRVGLARAACSEDPNQIRDEAEIAVKAQRYVKDVSLAIQAAGS